MRFDKQMFTSEFLIGQKWTKNGKKDTLHN